MGFRLALSLDKAAQLRALGPGQDLLCVCNVMYGNPARIRWLALCLAPGEGTSAGKFPSPVSGRSGALRGGRAGAGSALGLSGALWDALHDPAPWVSRKEARIATRFQKVQACAT